MTQFGKRLAPAAQSAALMPQSFPGRFLMPDGTEHRCEVTAIDPESALFLSDEAVPDGTTNAAIPAMNPPTRQPASRCRAVASSAAR